MSKNKKCVACGFEDFEENINNFCCNCGKDIDTGLTMEEMDKQGINYIIDRRTKHNNLGCLDCKQKDQRIAELEKENAELQKQLLETQSNFFIARKFILNKYSSLLTVESYKKILDKLY